jgi:hypothetical protein
MNMMGSPEGQVRMIEAPPSTSDAVPVTMATLPSSRSWGRNDGCSLGLRGDLQKAATGGTAILDFRTIGHNGWGAKAPEATRE